MLAFDKSDKFNFVILRLKELSNPVPEIELLEAPSILLLFIFKWIGVVYLDKILCDSLVFFDKVFV